MSKQQSEPPETWVEGIRSAPTQYCQVLLLLLLLIRSLLPMRSFLSTSLGKTGSSLDCPQLLLDKWASRPLFSVKTRAFWTTAAVGFIQTVLWRSSKWQLDRLRPGNKTFIATVSVPPTVSLSVVLVAAFNCTDSLLLLKSLLFSSSFP